PDGETGAEREPGLDGAIAGGADPRLALGERARRDAGGAAEHGRELDARGEVRLAGDARPEQPALGRDVRAHVERGADPAPARVEREAWLDGDAGRAGEVGLAAPGRGERHAGGETETVPATGEER